MGRYCIIKNCNTTPSDNLSLFKVPLNAEVRKKWINYVEKEGCKRAVDKINFHVCELHFLPELIKRHDSEFIRATLVAKSFPTIRKNFEVSQAIN